MPEDSLEVREAINSTLRDILSTDGWGRSHWDAVIKGLHQEFGIDTDLLTLAQTAPCLVQMFQMGALVRAGLISGKTKQTVSDTIRSLVSIAYRAEKGDENANNQLAVLHKMALPFSYDLPATIIKNLADSYDISPHLARAWSVRDLMVNLSFEVEPVRFDKSILEGPVRLALNRISRPKLHATAERLIRRNSTLQSLAISIYLEELDREDIALDVRQIKLDLQKLKEWEVINIKDDDPLHWLPLWHRAGEYPPAKLPAIPIYSDGWKRLWRRGDKKKKKLS